MMSPIVTNRSERRRMVSKWTVAIALVVLLASGARAQQVAPSLLEVMASRHDPANPASKLDDDLILARASLRQQRIEAEREPGRDLPPHWRGTVLTRVDAAGRVRVYIHLSTLEILDELAALDVEVEIVDARTRTVQAWIPPERLEAVAGFKEVVRIRPPGPAVARRGGVLSEGVGIAGADTLHELGIDGTGVKVAVISDGIAGRDESEASGDLPSNIITYSVTESGDIEGSWGGPDPGSEGTAMLEIIHDIAPGAELYFSNHDSSMAMAQSIQALATTYDCDIIVDDIGWYDQPFFEDGPIALAAQAVVNAGKVYVSAAGNDAEAHYQGMFVDSGEDYLDGDAHDFGAGDTTIEFSLDPGTQFFAALNWNTSYNNAAVDLDMLLSDDAGVIIASAAAMQSCSAAEPAGIAYESLEYTNDTSDVMVCSLRVTRHCPSGVNPELEIFTFGGEQLEHIVAADSTLGHPVAEGVIGCAAMDAWGEDWVVESFSSRGPATLYNGANGTDGLLTGRVERAKPDITGIDGVSVTGNGGFGSPFYGTSAAAPHVAACAALVMQARPELTGEQVRGVLLDSAMDMDPAGFDSASGAGMVDPVAALDMEAGPPPTGPTNTAPVAHADFVDTDEDVAATFDPFENDVDDEDDDLTIAGFTAPAHGVVSLDDDGFMVYTPEGDYHGTDTFVYTVEDTSGATASATVTITVTAVNDAPVAGDDSVITQEGSAVTAAVLDNDTDVEGDTLVVISVDQPGSGVALINDDGTVTYTPAAAFNGSDSFIYTVSDQNGGTATAEVAVTVVPVFKSLDDDPGTGSRACGVGVVSAPLVLLNIFGLTALSRRCAANMAARRRRA